MLALSPFLLASSLISGSLAATFNVEVGNGGLTFNPPTVKAAAGDEVVFTFFPKNHTLTQSTLAAPCTALPGGGDSGYMPVAAGSQGPTRRLVVPNANTPLWFYCAQGNHCQSGMVFSINPRDQAQQDQFVANARAFVPGQAPPPATTSTTPVTTATPPVAGTTQTIPPPSTSSTPTSGGAGRILEVVVGQGGLTFTPDRLTAAVGDTINFKFVGGSHTVTQSTFADPCSVLSGGFDSGPKPATAAAPVNVTYTVTDASKPQWFYCATGQHCRQGMVFSLNPPATGNTADVFKAAAIAGISGTPAGTDNSQTPGDSATSISGGVFGLLIAASLACLLL